MELDIKNKGLYNFISLFSEKERKALVEKLCLIGIEYLFQIHPSTKWTLEKIKREYNILYYENRCKFNENLIRSNISRNRNTLKTAAKSNESNFCSSNSNDSEQMQLKSPSKTKNDDDLKKLTISSQSTTNYYFSTYKENLINKHNEKIKRENSIRKKYKSQKIIRSLTNNLNNNDQYEPRLSAGSNENKNYKYFSIDNNSERKINKNSKSLKKFENEDLENIVNNENKAIFNSIDIDSNIREGKNSRNQNGFNHFNNYHYYYSFDKNDEEKSSNDKYNQLIHNDDYSGSNPYKVNDLNDNDYKITKEETINQPSNLTHKNNFISDNNLIRNYKQFSKKNRSTNNFLKNASTTNYNLNHKELQGSFFSNNALENRGKLISNDIYKITNRNID